MFLVLDIVLNAGLNLLKMEKGLKTKTENKKTINYKVFIPIGIVFLGAGVVYMLAVNIVLGISFMGIGGAWIAIGAAKMKQNEKEE